MSRSSSRKQKFFPVGAHVEIKIVNLAHKNQVRAKRNKPPLETDVVLE